MGAILYDKSAQDQFSQVSIINISEILRCCNNKNYVATDRITFSLGGKISLPTEYSKFEIYISANLSFEREIRDIQKFFVLISSLKEKRKAVSYTHCFSIFGARGR